MTRRKLYVALAVVFAAFITACADATGPTNTTNHECQLSNGTSTCTG